MLLNMFFSLNDVVATGEYTFYFTNYNHIKSQMEVYLQLYWGGIGYFDGQHAKVVVPGLFLPNGIAMSRDEK